MIKKAILGILALVVVIVVVLGAVIAMQPEDYKVDHSGYIYLMDKNGKYSKIFSYTTPEQDLARSVEHALE